MNINRTEKGLLSFENKVSSLYFAIDDIAFKFLAMHFGLAWGIKQKEFPQEKSQRCYFDKEFDSLGSPRRPKCTAFVLNVYYIRL